MNRREQRANGKKKRKVKISRPLFSFISNFSLLVNPVGFFLFSVSKNEKKNQRKKAIWRVNSRFDSNIYDQNGIM